MIQFRHRLSMILSLIIFVAIIATFDFDITLAFHRPGTGATIIGGQVYTSHDNAKELKPFFAQPQNDTLLFGSIPIQQLNGSSPTDANITATQPVNGTQNQALNATINEPEDTEEFLPVEEQRPQSSATHRNFPQLRGR